MSLFEELKRRNVFRVGIAYAVAAWLLLQVADVMIDNIGAPDWVFPTLLMVLGIGFPLALIFAWAFELTPEGIKRESEVDRNTSIAPQTGRKLDRAIIVVLALAVGYLLVDKLVLSDRPDPSVEVAEQRTATSGDEPAAASVAVLPFANMSADPDNEYFSDGLTDTLLHMLAQLPELKVAARTSSFAFKGQNKSVPAIAEELGVANILEGSVQRAGDQVRVTAQLIRASDGFHVWSQNYTRPLQDIFAIQDEIATDVADALGASLLGTGTTRVTSVETQDLSAYESYLRGLEQEALFTYTSLDAAERFYKQALAEDPEFTDARLALARNYLKKATTGMIEEETVHRQVQPLLDQVQADHPDNRLAQAYECVLTGRFSPVLRSREMNEAHVQRCADLLSLVPTETFVRVNVAGGVRYVMEDPQAALDLLKAGLLIDPLDPDLHLSVGALQEHLENFAEAEAAFRRAIDLAPGNPSAYGRMAILAKARNDMPEALDWLRRAVAIDPQDPELPYVLATDFIALDMPEEGERWLRRTESLAPGSPLARALRLEQAMRRGDADRSIAIATAMIEDEVDLRRGAYWRAVHHYTDLMMRLDREREAYEFLLAERPDIGDFDTVPEDARGRILQEYAIALMSGFATFDERLTAWEQFLAARAAMGLEIEEGSRRDVWNRLFRNDVDGAVTVFIDEVMTEPVADNLWAHREVMPDVFAPLDADPRIIAARAERKRAFDAMRDEVADMLMQPKWSDQETP